MARIRTIKPEFWSSHDLARDLTRDQRLFYIGLWTEADDAGRFVALPRKLLGAIFPYEEDLTEQWVSDSLRLLGVTGRVVFYDVRRTPYGEIVAWRRHQKINRPTDSRIPASNHEDAVLTESLTEGSLSGSTVEVGSRKLEVGEATPPADAPVAKRGKKPKTPKADRSALHAEVIDTYNAAVAELKAHRFRPVLCQSPSDKTLGAIDSLAEKYGADFLPRWHRICRWLHTDDRLAGRKRPAEGEDYWDWQADLPFLLRPAQWEKCDPKARQWEDDETARTAAAEMERAATERRNAAWEEERVRNSAAVTAKMTSRLEAVGLSREGWTGSPLAMFNEMVRREEAAKARS